MIPIKAEIGATAKANLEIKGEVSKGAVDRLVNAFADAISPFTERRGLKGDQIRLQRSELATQVAEMARQRLSANGLEPGAVPSKMLVPLLEKASLEEPDSEMLSRWASLLAAASTQFDMQHPVFPDVLSRISEREAKFLDQIRLRTPDLLQTQFSIDLGRRLITA